MNLSRRVSIFIKRHNVRFSSNLTCEEIRLPVPWGHIAGKWWGPQDKRPILTIHGWLDNCGSFDRLIPMLPRDVGYLAIDMPGHGYSSRLPPGAIYSSISGIMTIKLIQEYFQWKTISFLAHSNGALTSYCYGFMHPESVDFLICMDAMQMDRQPVNTANADAIRKALDYYVKFENSSLSNAITPKYTLEEMAQKLFEGCEGSIYLENCKYILKRNIIPVKGEPGLYHFNMDPRLKPFELINWSTEVYRKAAKLITFPVMIILAHDKVDYVGFKVNSFVNLMEASELFESHKLNATHHGHINDPEMFAELITKFIKKHDKQDRSTTFDFSQIKHTNN